MAGMLYVLSVQATEGQLCPRDWHRLPWRIMRDWCAQEKGRRFEREQRAELATAAARPTAGLPTPVPGTPVPPGYIPEEAKRVHQVNLDEDAEIPGLRGSNSLWQIGAVPTSDPYDYAIIYLFARPPTEGRPAALGLFPFGNTPITWNGYNMSWECPRDVGRITITGIEGLSLDQSVSTDDYN